MTVGLNYGNHNGNVFTSYFAAVTDIARGMGMGMVYWPGLRTGDSYSIESLDAEGRLQNNSASGVAQLKWGYGFGTVPPVNDQPPAPPGQVAPRPPRAAAWTSRLTPRPAEPSSTCGTATAAGTSRGTTPPTHLLTVYSNKCMQAGTGRVAAGDAVVIEDCTGVPAQQWNVNANGTITNAAEPALCLDAAAGAAGTARCSTSRPATETPISSGQEADRRTRTDLNLRARRHRRGAPGDRGPQAGHVQIGRDRPQVPIYPC